MYYRIDYTQTRRGPETGDDSRWQDEQCKNGKAFLVQKYLYKCTNTDWYMRVQVTLEEMEGAIAAVRAKAEADYASQVILLLIYYLVYYTQIRALGEIERAIAADAEACGGVAWCTHAEVRGVRMRRCEV